MWDTEERHSLEKQTIISQWHEEPQLDDINFLNDNATGLRPLGGSMKILTVQVNEHYPKKVGGHGLHAYDYTHQGTSSDIVRSQVTDTLQEENASN